MRAVELEVAVECEVVLEMEAMAAAVQSAVRYDTIGMGATIATVRRTALVQDAATEMEACE